MASVAIVMGSLVASGHVRAKQPKRVSSRALVPQLVPAAHPGCNSVARGQQTMAFAAVVTRHFMELMLHKSQAAENYKAVDGD